MVSFYSIRCFKDERSVHIRSGSITSGRESEGGGFWQRSGTRLAVQVGHRPASHSLSHLFLSLSFSFFRSEANLNVADSTTTRRFGSTKRNVSSRKRRMCVPFHHQHPAASTVGCPRDGACFGFRRRGWTGGAVRSICWQWTSTRMPTQVRPLYESSFLIFMFILRL